MKSEPIIAVKDVEKSSVFYQNLLGCISRHGGNVFEILTNRKGEQILSLHKWGEHEHPNTYQSRTCRKWTYTLFCSK